MVFELQIALEIEFKFQTLLKLGVGGKGNLLWINAAKFTPTPNYLQIVSNVQIDMDATGWMFFLHLVILHFTSHFLDDVVFYKSFLYNCFLFCNI